MADRTGGARYFPGAGLCGLGTAWAEPAPFYFPRVTLYPIQPMATAAEIPPNANITISKRLTSPRS